MRWEQGQSKQKACERLPRMKKQPNIWRTTYEVPERKWPVVSRKALGDLKLNSLLVQEDWNQLVRALASGYVQLSNVGLWARQARLQALKAHNRELAAELDHRIEEIGNTLENWPMEIVG